MSEQRNTFITNMNNSIANHKKHFQTILSKLGWTLQSVHDTVKDENNDETNDNKEENENEDGTINDKFRKENHVNKEAESKESKINDAQIEDVKIETLCLGTSKDSEKLYNELLASLAFQPKLKKEKLSDRELLASLLESERNAKRRRISYRNKIHTKNKSQTEVLREVIREQMEVLKCEEDGCEDSKDNRNEKKEDNEDMIEVSVTEGNPHLAWQTVGLVATDQQTKDLKQRYDRHNSNSWDRTSAHRKHRHKSPSYRDKSPKYYKDDHNRKSTHHHHEKSSNKSQSSSKQNTEKNSDRGDKSPRHRRHKRKHSKSRRSVSQENESRRRNKRRKHHSDYD